jgi:hypothetical protein
VDRMTKLVRLASRARFTSRSALRRQTPGKSRMPVGLIVRGSNGHPPRSWTRSNVKEVGERSTRRFGSKDGGKCWYKPVDGRCTTRRRCVRANLTG